MLEAHRHSCAICDSAFDGIPCVDHDDITGRVALDAWLPATKEPPRDREVVMPVTLKTSGPSERVVQRERKVQNVSYVGGPDQ
jgi:hypothetical protein